MASDGQRQGCRVSCLVSGRSSCREPATADDEDAEEARRAGRASAIWFQRRTEGQNEIGKEVAAAVGGSS
jgi:hypothetical protein